MYSPFGQFMHDTVSLILALPASFVLMYWPSGEFVHYVLALRVVRDPKILRVPIFRVRKVKNRNIFFGFLILV